MIRAWLATARRRHAAPGVHRVPVDEVTFLGAQFDVAAAQIEGLRTALAEAQKELAEEKAGRAHDVALLRAALAKYTAQEVMRAGLMEHMRRPARERERSAALEPTVAVTTEELRRARPAGSAPATEQYRRPR